MCVLTGSTALSVLLVLTYRPKLLLLFKAYFAAYASGLWMLVFWDAHKSDYRAMALHHVATLVLTALAYNVG